METIINLIIQLIAGVVGGNAAGAALKDYNLGNLGNTIAVPSAASAEVKFCKPSFRRSQARRPAATSISGPSWVKSSAAAPEARSSRSSPDW
jgi:hypothetical protein